MQHAAQATKRAVSQPVVDLTALSPVLSGQRRHDASHGHLLGKVCAAPHQANRSIGTAKKDWVARRRICGGASSPTRQLEQRLNAPRTHRMKRLLAFLKQRVAVLARCVEVRAGHGKGGHWVGDRRSEPIEYRAFSVHTRDARLLGHKDAIALVPGELHGQDRIATATGTTTARGAA